MSFMDDHWVMKLEVMNFKVMLCKDLLWRTHTQARAMLCPRYEPSDLLSPIFIHVIDNQSQPKPKPY